MVSIKVGKIDGHLRVGDATMGTVGYNQRIGTKRNEDKCLYAC